jgi:protein-S-isoprenylcysteine O-methyltransferase Ste14
METSLLILSVLTFALVCALPFIFFRRDGSFNLMWCLTASPYVIYPTIIILGYLGKLTTFAIPAETLSIMQSVSTIFYIASLCIMSLTLGTHRIPLALWHQDNDAPKSIITFGAYAKFRHPFYTSFILALTGGLLTFPNILALLTSVIAISLLTMTAMKEEKKLSQSEFGKEYQEYIKTTGRFFPRIF